jgi:pimeloyl-ACP methyl ester carboxylesterase
MSDTPQRAYADIDGLRLYYEIHGEPRPNQRPLLLLHGGMMSAASLGSLLPALAQTRRVIAVDLEGHGHTADLDRPLSANQMAHDIAVLIERLDAQPADVCGFSLGGLTALRLAMIRPDLVHKLVLISVVYNNDGYYPATKEGWPNFSSAAFVGSPFEREYAEQAPDPSHWPDFITKMGQALMSFPGWAPAEIQVITAPALLILGDADLVRPEHAVELFHLLGGALPDGGMAGVPASRMAMLPATTHFTILSRTDLLLPIILPFLDEDMATSSERTTA